MIKHEYERAKEFEVITEPKHQNLWWFYKSNNVWESGLDHVNPPALLNIVLSGKVRLVNDARLDQKPIRLFTIKGVPPMKLVKFLKKFEKT
jgi:hypothetical protein